MRISINVSGSLLLLAIALAGCQQVDNTQRAEAESSTPAEITHLQERIVALSRQRATPDQTISSYFEAVDVQEQLSCYEEVRRRADPCLQQSNMSAVADAFFHAEALESRTRYRRDLTGCLRWRGKLSLEFRDVHMDTPTHASVVINLKNETPIPETAVGDDQDRRRRRDGEEFKIQLTKLSDGWKIDQIFSHPYASTDWRPQFSSEEYFPSFVFFPTTP